MDLNQSFNTVMKKSQIFTDSKMLKSVYFLSGQSSSLNAFTGRRFIIACDSAAVEITCGLSGIARDEVCC